MLGRDLLAVGFLRGMPEPIRDLRYEPLGGNQIPDGMVIVLRMAAAQNGIGHPAIKQDGRYRMLFRKALGDRPQHPVGLA